MIIINIKYKNIIKINILLKRKLYQPMQKTLSTTYLAWAEFEGVNRLSTRYISHYPTNLVPVFLCDQSEVFFLSGNY